MDVWKYEVAGVYLEGFMLSAQVMSKGSECGDRARSCAFHGSFDGEMAR